MGSGMSLVIFWFDSIDLKFVQQRSDLELRSSVYPHLLFEAVGHYVEQSLATAQIR